MQESRVDPSPAALPGLRRRTAGVVVKTVPGLMSLLQTERGQGVRHWFELRFGRRVHYTFTRFHRSPKQMEALVGPVLDWILGPNHGGALRIVVLGCSIGAEPYTIASILLHHRPDVDFSVEGFDILDSVVDRARKGQYTAREVLGSPDADEHFVTRTFERREDEFRIRPAIARRVRFDCANVLDPTMSDRVGTADLVFAQNLLMNLSRPQARRAFPNISRLLRRRSALFIDGVDLDLRVKLTRAAGLTPLDYRVREIHEEALAIRGGRYPNDYSGLPPYREGPDSTRKFGTIFLKD